VGAESALAVYLFSPTIQFSTSLFDQKGRGET